MIRYSIQLNIWIVRHVKELMNISEKLRPLNPSYMLLILQTKYIWGKITGQQKRETFSIFRNSINMTPGVLLSNFEPPWENTIRHMMDQMKCLNKTLYTLSTLTSRSLASNWGFTKTMPGFGRTFLLLVHMVEITYKIFSSFPISKYVLAERLKMSQIIFLADQQCLKNSFTRLPKTQQQYNDACIISQNSSHKISSNKTVAAAVLFKVDTIKNIKRVKFSQGPAITVDRM